MDEHQFARLQASRRRHGPKPLFATQIPARIIRRASRASQRLEQVAEVWERICDPGLKSASRIESLQGDALVISAASPAVHFALRQAAPALARQLSRLLPGVRQVRVVREGEAGDMMHD